MTRRVAGSVFAFVLCLAAPVRADDWLVKFSSGVDYTSGDYGDVENTDIIYLPFTAKVKYGHWTTKVTVPYVRIKGPGTVVVGGDTGPINTGATTIAVTTEDGLGDIVSSLSYEFDLERMNTFIDLTGKVKIPTADDKRNLGTGKTDYTVQIDVTKMLNRFMALGTVGYKFVGSSARFQLDDVFFFSAGGGYQFSHTVSAGVIYDYRQAASRTAQDPSEIVAYLNWRVNEHVGAHNFRRSARTGHFW